MWENDWLQYYVSTTDIDMNMIHVYLTYFESLH